MRLRLDYGTDGLDVDLPDERVTVIEPVPRPAVPDAHATLLAAMRSPLDRARAARDQDSQRVAQLQAERRALRERRPELVEGPRMGGKCDVIIRARR